MRILHLITKKKWFDLIASGEKTEEYREDKPYWIKRLINDDEDGTGKEFDIVRFRNGYRKDSPVVDVEFKKILFSGRKWMTPKHGEVLADSVIIIKLGRVLK